MTPSFRDLFYLLPLLVLAATPVVAMLGIAFYRNHRLTLALTLSGLALAFGTFAGVSPRLQQPRSITSLLLLDDYGLFYLGLILIASGVVAILSYGYLEQREGPCEEFYLLLLLATLGSAVLVVSHHFASFFLGLEVLSVSLYGLMAYVRSSEKGLEAGLKYLILAATSAAFLLFGLALIYAELGTMEFTPLASRMVLSDVYNAWLLAGLALMVVGIGFKLAVVPFHLWTPDVYEGAPAPVTAFVATASKGAVFALLLRYFAQVDRLGSLWLVFALIAVASMFVGNLLALLQNNVKRILAYSSIAHLGYLLVAFVSGGERMVTAVAYYLAAYTVTTLIAFGLVTVLSGPGREAEDLEDYRGLFWRQPYLAGIFTAALLSLAGIPLTGGFIGKFYVVMVGAEAAQWWLVVLLVANSAIGLYYYLRIVVAMAAPPVPEGARVTVPWARGLVLAALTLLLVGLGVYPGPFIYLIQHTVARVMSPDSTAFQSLFDRTTGLWTIGLRMESGGAGPGSGWLGWPSG